MVEKLDLSKYKSPEEAARALYKHLKDLGYREAGLCRPGDEYNPAGKWGVVLEGAPLSAGGGDWGVRLTCGGDTLDVDGDSVIDGPWLAEPYYGFDVYFSKS